MDDQIAQRLGVPPGPTLVALAKLAKKLDSRSPSGAFGELSLHLPWVKSKSDLAAEALLSEESLGGFQDWHRRAILGRYLATPTNVVPFAHTGNATDHFGLVRSEAPVEEWAVVQVLPGEPDEATQVVAPNLRSFLGLACFARATTIRRDASADVYRVWRKLTFRMWPEKEAELDRIAKAVLSGVPGVALPLDPSSVVSASPRMRFTLSIPFSDPSRQSLVVSARDSARGAAEYAAGLLAIDEPVLAVAAARRGMLHPASLARSQYLLSRALARSGDRDQALVVAEALVVAWSSAAPLLPPAVHARNVVLPDELVALLVELRHPRLAEWQSSIVNAGDIEDAPGDLI